MSEQVIELTGKAERFAQSSQVLKGWSPATHRGMIGTIRPNLIQTINGPPATGMLQSAPVTGEEL